MPLFCTSVIFISLSGSVDAVVVRRNVCVRFNGSGVPIKATDVPGVSSEVIWKETEHNGFLNLKYACLVAHVCRASCFRSEARILPGIRKTKSGTGYQVSRMCVI